MAHKIKICYGYDLKCLALLRKFSMKISQSLRMADWSKLSTEVRWTFCKTHGHLVQSFLHEEPRPPRSIPWGAWRWHSSCVSISLSVCHAWVAPSFLHLPFCRYFRHQVEVLFKWFFKMCQSLRNGSTNPQLFYELGDFWESDVQFTHYFRPQSAGAWHMYLNYDRVELRI